MANEASAVQTALQPVLNGAAEPSASEGTPTDIEAIESEVTGEPVESDAGAEGDAIDAAEKAGDLSKKEAAALRKKLKLKVDGQEFEEEIDFNDDDSLKRHLQKSRAFDKRMQEFSTYKQQVDAIIEMLENDPEALLERMGKNVDELAEQRLRRRVEELKKSPEQLEREKMERELQALREEKRRIEEEKQQSEMERMRNEHAVKIEADIKEALDAQNTVLPKRNKTIIARIGQAMYLAMKNGYPEVTAKDVIPFVEKQYKAELQELFSVLPEDTIEAIIGKEPLNRWRKSLVSKAKAATPATTKPKIEDTGVSKKSKTEESGQKISYSDFFKLNT